jgi:hypothetical protein
VSHVPGALPRLLRECLVHQHVCARESHAGPRERVTSVRGSRPPARRTNIETYDLTRWPAQIQQGRAAAVQRLYDYLLLVNATSALRANLTAQLNISGLVARVDAAQDRLDSVQDLLAPFVQLVQDIVDQARARAALCPAAPRGTASRTRAAVRAG